MSSVGPDGMLLGSGEWKGNDNAGEGKMETATVEIRIRAALIGLVVPWPSDLSPKPLGIRFPPLGGAKKDGKVGRQESAWKPL